MIKSFIAHRPKTPAPSQAKENKEAARAATLPPPKQSSKQAKEIGGPEGPEPTRYGDWERKGICVDF